MFCLENARRSNGGSFKGAAEKEEAAPVGGSSKSKSADIDQARRNE
jgi:hypothetical protein